jgi:hypothetical protein
MGVEPRDHTVIRGASGIDHSVFGLGVDDKSKRLLLVSADPDPRVSAMMQVDIQATMSDVKVLVARPLFFDLGELARTIIHRFGRDTFVFEDIRVACEDLKKQPKEVTEQIVKERFAEIGRHLFGFGKLPLPAFSQLISVVQQALYLEWSQIWRGDLRDNTAVVALGPLAKIDNLKIDRQFGVCPIPLYELTESDWEMALSGKDIDEIRELYKGLGIYQYFFPAPDSLALGLIDRGLSEPQAIESAVATTPNMGHPLGPTELIGRDVTITELVENLKGSGFIVEGEIGVEMTAQGSSARAIVKFRPSESLFSKLLNRINVNLSLSGKDLMGP